MKLGQANAPGNRFAAISARVYHTCALSQDGEVAYWGSDSYDVTKVPDGVYMAVSVGEPHSCALRDNGDAVCWGGTIQPGPGCPWRAVRYDQRRWPSHLGAESGRHGRLLGRQRRQRDSPAGQPLQDDERGMESHLRTVRGRRGNVLGRRRVRPVLAARRRLRRDSSRVRSELRSAP